VESLKPKPDLWVGRSGAEVNGVEIGDSPAFLVLNGAGVLRRLKAVFDFEFGGGLLDPGLLAVLAVVLVVGTDDPLDTSFDSALLKLLANLGTGAWAGTNPR